MPEDKKPKPSNNPQERKDNPMPPAGPHAREDLTDYSKTPGTGSLPDKPSGGSETDVGTG